VDGDFTSVVFPFLAHADRGVTVRHEPLEKLADAIGPRTAVVAYSLVQSSDGRVADVAAIRAAATGAGAVTVCDVTQAAGWLPFSAAEHDITVGAAYKWLCAPRGVAFLTVSPDLTDRLRPIHAGWYAGEAVWDSIYGPRMRLATDARRFDVSPAWLSWVGAASAIRAFADADLGAVRDHDVGLADRLRAGLGLPPAGSAIVSLEDPDRSLLDRFGRAGLSVSGRAGRVRIAFHVWNDEDDLARVLDVTAGRGPRSRGSDGGQM
jgi:selenocysteine lyase/cysteine desulfurase